MPAPALDRLRDEIAEIVACYGVGELSNWNAAGTILKAITRHIPADVLAGLLDGTMVAVPREPTRAMLDAAEHEVMDSAAHNYGAPPASVDIYRAMLAAAKPEDRA